MRETALIFNSIFPGATETNPAVLRLQAKTLLKIDTELNLLSERTRKLLFRRNFERRVEAISVTEAKAREKCEEWLHTDGQRLVFANRESSENLDFNSRQTPFKFDEESTRRQIQILDEGHSRAEQSLFQGSVNESGAKNGGSAVHSELKQTVESDSEGSFCECETYRTLEDKSLQSCPVTVSSQSCVTLQNSSVDIADLSFISLKSGSSEPSAFLSDRENTCDRESVRTQGQNTSHDGDDEYDQDDVSVDIFGLSFVSDGDNSNQEFSLSGATEDAERELLSCPSQTEVWFTDKNSSDHSTQTLGKDSCESRSVTTDHFWTEKSASDLGQDLTKCSAGESEQKNVPGRPDSSGVCISEPSFLSLRLVQSESSLQRSKGRGSENSKEATASEWSFFSERENDGQRQQNISATDCKVKSQSSFDFSVDHSQPPEHHLSETTVGNASKTQLDSGRAHKGETQSFLSVVQQTESPSSCQNEAAQKSQQQLDNSGTFEDSSNAVRDVFQHSFEFYACRCHWTNQDCGVPHRSSPSCLVTSSLNRREVLDSRERTSVSSRSESSLDCRKRKPSDGWQIRSNFGFRDDSMRFRVREDFIISPHYFTAATNAESSPDVCTSCGGRKRMKSSVRSSTSHPEVHSLDWEWEDKREIFTSRRKLYVGRHRQSEEFSPQQSLLRTRQPSDHSDYKTCSSCSCLYLDLDDNWHDVSVSSSTYQQVQHCLQRSDYMYHIAPVEPNDVQFISDTVENAQHITVEQLISVFDQLDGWYRLVAETSTVATGDSLHCDRNELLSVQAELVLSGKGDSPLIDSTLVQTRTEVILGPPLHQTSAENDIMVSLWSLVLFYWLDTFYSFASVFTSLLVYI